MRAVAVGVFWEHFFNVDKIESEETPIFLLFILVRFLFLKNEQNI